MLVMLFLHQTTTIDEVFRSNSKLLVMLFLHQTTTDGLTSSGANKLLVMLFLHQTTTLDFFMPCFKKVVCFHNKENLCDRSQRSGI